MNKRQNTAHNVNELQVAAKIGGSDPFLTPLCSYRTMRTWARRHGFTNDPRFMRTLSAVTATYRDNLMVVSPRLAILWVAAGDKLRAARMFEHYMDDAGYKSHDQYLATWRDMVFNTRLNTQPIADVTYHRALSSSFRDFKEPLPAKGSMVWPPMYGLSTRNLKDRIIPFSWFVATAARRCPKMVADDLTAHPYPTQQQQQAMAFAWADATPTNRVGNAPALLANRHKRGIPTQ